MTINTQGMTRFVAIGDDGERWEYLCNDPQCAALLAAEDHGGDPEDYIVEETLADHEGGRKRDEMMTRTITDVTVYWDSQDISNEGWAYRASDADGDIASGGIDDIEDDDLCGAIDAACFELDLDLTHDDFGMEPHIDGGYGTWSAE